MKTDCARCAIYAELRGPRILAEIRKTAQDEKRVRERWLEFLDKYHGLHSMAGRFVALMASTQPECSCSCHTAGLIAAHIVPCCVRSGEKDGGSDDQSTQPEDRPSASRSARPPSGRSGRRRGGKTRPNQQEIAP